MVRSDIFFIHHDILYIRKAHSLIISSPVFTINKSRDIYKSYNILSWEE